MNNNLHKVFCRMSSMVDKFYIDLGMIVKYLFILCVSGDFSVPYYMYVILWLCAMTSLQPS